MTASFESRSFESRSFESLAAEWGPGVEVGPPRPGRHRNEVRSVTARGVDCVGRLSRRPAASLDWEHALLDALAGEGIPVPRPLPSRSGASHVQGLTLTPKLAGDHPSSPADWTRVAELLRRVHRLTKGWPQRPDIIDWSLAGGELSAVRDWASRTGLDPELATRYAAARAALPGPEGVTVGRTRRRDITMTASGPALVDWDEARVDRTLLDFVSDPALAEHAGVDAAVRTELEQCDRSWIELRGLPPAQRQTMEDR